MNRFGIHADGDCPSNGKVVIARNSCMCRDIISSITTSLHIRLQNLSAHSYWEVVRETIKPA